MAAFTFFNNFTSGEVSPRIYPRTDLVQRKNGAKRLENALPTVSGGWIGRPGTRFVCACKYAARITRLIPFKYSIDQTYVIELGDRYMRFITNGGRLEDTSQNVTGTGLGASSRVRITKATHGYSSGNFVAVRSILGTYEANGDWEIVVIDADNFDLVGSVYTRAYTSGGTVARIIEIVSPYTAAQLEDVQYAPDADLMYFVHPDVRQQVLTRTSATTFTIGDLDLIGGPFNDLNPTDSHTMTASATTGAITVTSSTAYFVAAMVGHLMRIGSTVSGVQGYVEITGFTNSTRVNATVIKQLSTALATSIWNLGAFGPYTGYPRTVSWFDQRLMFGGTDFQPQTCWLSATTRVRDFSIGTAASDAVTFSLRTDEVNDIQWVASSSDLIIGASGGEHKASGGNNDVLSPTSTIARQQTAYGSKKIRPVKIGDLVIHVQRGGDRLRQVSFSFDKDQYISNDLTLLAQHLFEDAEITDLSFQLQPDPILWTVLASGELRSCTILPEQNVVAFARHTFAGAFVKRCVSLPRRASTKDETYIAISRKINSIPVQYIEVFDYDLQVDCGLSATFGSPVSGVSGLAHLEGETVRIACDGAVYEDQTVSANAIDFKDTENTATAVQVGLGFVPTCILLSPEWELQTGPTFGRKKCYNKVHIFTNDTQYLAVNGEVSEARSSEDFMDAAPTVAANGIHEFAPSGSAAELHLTITQPDPLYVSVVGVYGECTIGD